MIYFTFCDPKYFLYSLALIKSIRLNGNDQKIIILLMDFLKDQELEALSYLSKVENIEILKVNSDNIFGKSEEPLEIKNYKRQEFYRNYRINLYEKILKDSAEDLFVLCANGIVRTNLSYIEEISKENQMIFLERPRENHYSEFPEKIEGIYELADMIKENKLEDKIDEIISSHTGRCVLTGAHFIKNCDESIQIIKTWKDLIVQNKSSYYTKFCDMDYFVKSMIINYYKGLKLKIYTSKNVPREISPICDTTFGNASMIWFAKGPSKFQNKKYLETVKYLISK